jgi:hypothetical protein
MFISVYSLEKIKRLADKASQKMGDMPDVQFSSGSASSVGLSPGVAIGRFPFGGTIQNSTSGLSRYPPN